MQSRNKDDLKGTRVGPHLPGMRDANHSIDVFKSSREEFVRQYARCIFEAKETVIGEYGPRAKMVCV